MSLKIILSIVLAQAIQLLALPIDNGVVGEPEIQCSTDNILVTFNTKNPFEGHVYVKGHYNEQGCRVDASNAKSAALKLPFTSCGIKRQRSTSPAGLYVSATVVITFHPMFITKIDKAYQVRCFYTEADKTVTSQLEVSQLTTQVISQNIAMPACKYEVLSEGPTGQLLRYSKVGDKVYHKWSCESPEADLFCMTVHSCTVDDGQGKVVQLSDENGCSLDKYALQNVQYQSDLVGGRESHVFKFADKPTLLFQCQIKLSVKEGGKCVRSSDKCPEPVRGKRAADEETEERVDSDNGEDFDVTSNAIVVLDVDEPPELADRDIASLRQSGSAQDFHGVCMSSVTFGIVVAVMIVILISAVVATAVVCFKKTHVEPKA